MVVGAYALAFHGLPRATGSASSLDGFADFTSLNRCEILQKLIDTPIHFEYLSGIQGDETSSCLANKSIISVSFSTNLKQRSLNMSEDFLNAPTSASVRLIDFDQAKVVSGIVPRTYILIVSGTKPYLNMTVELSPLVYIRRPEYWGIEVVGSLPGMGLPATAPYTVSLPLDGVLGTKGIEVIGANKREKIKVPLRSERRGSKKAEAKKSK